jgi:hypothetical protein
VDEDGNVGTQRKNYGWANASRPVDLLLKNAYTPEKPGVFGNKIFCFIFI